MHGLTLVSPKFPGSVRSLLLKRIKGMYMRKSKDYQQNTADSQTPSSTPTFSSPSTSSQLSTKMSRRKLQLSNHY